MTMSGDKSLHFLHLYE